MRVRVKLFAALRETTGRGEWQTEVEPGATAEQVWERLVADHPGLATRRRHLAAAVNRRYVAFDTPLADGDELVFVPPVSGG